MNKICTKCKRNLDISCFRKSGKYYRSECKECSKRLYKEWYNKNKDKRKQHNRNKAKKSYYKNREHYLENAKTYRETHKEEIKNYKHNYYQKHKESLNEKHKDNYIKYNYYYKDYYQNNKEKIKEYNRKRMENPIIRLKKQVRNMLYESFKRKNKNKKEHSEKILGCDLDFFVNYLLDTYKNNYGIEWNKVEKVHIDHIIPLATAKTEEDVIKLCHYTNLQLLKAKDNLHKGSNDEWFESNFKEV